MPGSKVSAESRRGKKRVTRMVVFVVLGKLINSATLSITMKLMIRIEMIEKKYSESSVIRITLKLPY